MVPFGVDLEKPWRTLTRMLLLTSIAWRNVNNRSESSMPIELYRCPGEGRNKGGRKSQRESLASLQTPRYRQGLLNLTGDGREQDEQGRGDGEGGAEGERRGQPTPRTGIGTVTGGRGSASSREPKRKAREARSELSTSQAAGWRQLTLNFGGTGGEGRAGGGKQGGRGGSEQRAGTTQDAARPQYGAQNDSTSGNRSQ